MSTPLKAEFEYYLANQDELVRQYRGRFIVIKDQQVVSAHDALADALKEAQGKFELGTFLLQKVEPGTSGYTQTFHSRVA